MIRSYSLAVASLFAALACSDHAGTTAPIGPDELTPSPPSLAVLTGIVVVERVANYPATIRLREPDGTLTLLVGSESRPMASVADAEVSVHGTWDASPGLVVERFQVLSMNGRPALDGVLEATATGFALRLNDGTYREISASPSEIAQYVGARLWVTGSADDQPVTFGVIEAR
jgi:hypothetical protein